MLTALLVCLISVAWPGGFVFLYLRLPDFLAQGYHTYKILLSSDHSSSPITRHVFYTQPFCWLQRSLLPLIAERARHRNVPRQQLLSFSGACCSLTAFLSLLINWTKCFCFRLCRKCVFHTEDRVFPWHGSSVNKQIFFHGTVFWQCAVIHLQSMLDSGSRYTFSTGFTFLLWTPINCSRW